ncbi:hypothetical protein [cf. Phormidesmis sp. LEGE 11477]|uniref:hypothetical protein n=1 Tax=cf. Phormidesmis sp. LEGE 11477 TaxID=1828680 RepID=UPI00188187B5|nr:hypothetical protein [cf. Phormidesmis sp. LEGE 11477]MBE9063572.1 hypothetical protein [cf. Phormidesmis sp. LEGE 11477]
MNALTPLVALLLGVQPSQNPALGLFELPDGEHYYVEPISSELTGDRTLFLQKWGRIVVGVDTISSFNSTCFKGFVEADAIVNATRVLPPYTPNAEWTYQPGEMTNLSNYDRRIEAIAATDRAALDICLEVFAR